MISRFGREEKEALCRVIDASDKTLSRYSFSYRAEGGEVWNFEREFARWLGRKYCVAVNSGTSALLVAIKALSIKTDAILGKNDCLELTDQKISIPAYTFVADAEAVVACGNLPRFEDIDPQTYCVDSPQQECDLVIPVHTLGNVCDPWWMKDYQRREIPIIEDCAQAIGTKWGGERVGNFGDVACFFSHTKILTPNGKIPISKICIGDEVITRTGISKVKQVHKRQYDDLWVKFQYGKNDTSLRLCVTKDHPILIYRAEKELWLPAKELVVGDEVYVPTSLCKMCNTAIPFYRNFCKSCFPSQDPKARSHLRQLHLKSSKTLKPSTNKHHIEDVLPIMIKWQKNGYKVAPMAGVIQTLLLLRIINLLLLKLNQKLDPS